jgi:hypothetical protein
MRGELQQMTSLNAFTIIAVFLPKPPWAALVKPNTRLLLLTAVTAHLRGRRRCCCNEQYQLNHQA